MLRNTSILRTAIALATAVLFSQTLAGCSGATSALPGSGSALAMQQNATASQPRTSSRKLGEAVKPNEEEPCTGNMNVQGPATFWDESLGPPITWTEIYGYYVPEQTDNGTIYSPCPGSTYLLTCSPSATCPGSTMGYHVQVSEALAMQNFKCEKCFVVAQASANNLAVMTTNSKYVVKQVGTLSATLGSVTYSPVGVAVAKNGTIYAAVVSVVGSGFGESCIVVYPPNSSQPTSMLWDKGLDQGAVPAIAVDLKGDVFVAYSSGSQNSTQIDEFPIGRTSPVPFATMNGSSTALTVTKKGDVVASSISLGSGAGQIVEFSPKGTPITNVVVEGMPDAISLDSSNEHIWVDDAINDAISEYAFPAGGAPLFSAPVETAQGAPLVPADFLPKDSPK